MAFPNLFKLEKLKILAYDDCERKALRDTFEAMFNPESISQTFMTRFNPPKSIHNPAQVAKFASHLPTTLNLKLLIDGTGVGRMGLASLLDPSKSVKDQIDTFLEMTYSVQGETHEPTYLTVLWGAIDFPCRLSKATVTYTSFDRSGEPLRAELDLDLTADEELEKQKAKAGFSSPDVSHMRIVKSGDTLPLLTKEIYGTARYYLRVARANQLNHFRRLAPGQELAFPPLASRTGSRG